MINKKRVNKVTKLTVASAIAFSALAQPLGNVITVKAAETPATTKAERQLLTAVQNVTLQNTQFIGTETGIPGWTGVAVESNIPRADYTMTNVSLTRQSDGTYPLSPGNNVKPNGQGGYRLTISPAKYVVGLQQIIDTIPGVTYTFKYKVKTISSQQYVPSTSFASSRIIAGTGEIAVAMPVGGPGITFGVEQQNVATFTATSTKTPLTITGSTASTIQSNNPYSGVIDYWDFSLTSSAPENIARPTINAVTDEDTLVTGTGTAGKTARIELPDGSYKTGTVGSDGKYSIVIPKQVKDKVIKVMLYDDQGNVSPEASTTVAAATVAPPTINAVTSDDTTVKGTGVNGATVTLTIGGTNYTGTVSGGEYSITIPKQNAGTVISATESLNGKTSTSVNTTVTQGSVAAPTINGVKSDDTTVKGRGIPGATVTVTIAGQGRTATVDANGDYSVTIPAQAVGTEITAKQTLNGKTSDSVSTTVTQGTVAIPTIDTVTTDDTTLKGSGINGATVTVKVGSQEYTATVGQDGKYSITIPKQAFGTAITAKQTLNGQTSSEANTTVTQGAVTAPAINTVTADDTAVKGTGTKGATVKLTIGSETYTGTVDNDGNYSITIPKQPKDTVISATQTLNGKTSSPSTTTVQAGMAATTINSLTTDSTTASGTAEPNATIVIKNQAGTQLATGRVGSDGVYSVTIAKQASGAVVTATATKDGKTSSASTTVTRDSIDPTTLDTLTADSTTASGTAEPNATIVIKNAAGTTLGTGTVGSDGKYSITIPKQAAGTVVTATATKDGKSANASTTVAAGQGIAATTLGALTNNSTTASGTGEPNATIVIKAGSTTLATGTIGSDGKYSLTIPKQAEGTVVTATPTKDGKTSSASVTVSKQAAGTIAITAPYYVGYDAGIKATVSGDATKVYLLVGDTKYTTVPVNGSFEYYAKDKITSTTQNAYLVALDASGKELSRAKVTLKDGNLLRGTVTPQDYIIGGGNYITGAYTGAVTKVAVSVNGTVYPSVPVTGAGALQYYVKDKITDKTDIVKLIGYNSEGTQIAIAPVTVHGSDALTGALTANPTNFVISTDSYVKGTYTGNVKTVALVVNGVESAKVGVVDGTTWQYYAKGKILNPSDTVSVKGYNVAGTLVSTVDLTVSQNPVGQSTITPEAFKLKTDSFVKGTFTGSVRYVALKVGDVTYPKVGVVDATNWQYYAKDKITSTTAAVSILGYDSTGTKIAESAVTVNPENASSLTADTYKLGDGNVTGAYTGEVKYVAVKVNTNSYGKVPVADDGTYKYYIKDKVSSKDDVVTVYGYDATGAVVAQKVVTIDPGVAPTMTVNDFVIGTSKEVTGTYTGGIKYVAIKVGDSSYSKVPVADDGTYKYYAKDKITNAATKVIVQGYNAVGLALEKEVTVR
ncbi:immunoglobulin-like domain-containing protein [Listeria booriae]|uniref:immunoglobulin-like domain-containing protein n=1 Tax=Listeria booriae TaxID=1552123 RepID=UPI0021AB30F4|nr:immunoglobulin-like domain-containing protein [Listeria booriae]